MLNAIITGLFGLIAKLGDIIISPFVLLISSFLPDFSTFYSSIITFIGYGFQYLSFFMKLLCIPKNCMLMLYTIAVANLSIMLGVRVYLLITRIYNKFKL